MMQYVPERECALSHSCWKCPQPSAIIPLCKKKEKKEKYFDVKKKEEITEREKTENCLFCRKCNNLGAFYFFFCLFLSNDQCKNVHKKSTRSSRNAL